MTDSLIISHRFCGPPDSGNGGYTCGLIAAYLDGPAEITLRRPPPLTTPMAIERDGEGSVRVFDGRTLVAEGTCLSGSLAMEVPDPVSIREARAARTRSRLRAHPEEHPFPTCFVCGPDRRPEDGLRILVGPVTGRGLSADIWYPHETLADADGNIRPEFVWAALDCAGGISALDGTAPNGPPFVLGGSQPVKSPQSSRASHISWPAGA
ncbi:MAG: hypothetical protein ACM3ML_05805 [Micromonosporaceae bacterium]